MWNIYILMVGGRSLDLGPSKDERMKMRIDMKKKIKMMKEKENEEKKILTPYGVGFIYVYMEVYICIEE